jgi:formate hydrogenlyase transcriptional activator
MNDATAQQDLQVQNQRLRLLLDLTNKIASNLDLREVVRSISGNVREVMLGDLVCVALPDAESGKMRIYALDFPGSPGIVQEGMLVVLWGGGKAAIDNQKPVIAITTAPDEFPIELNEHLHSLEEPKTVCHIPLVIRGRALGLLAIGRTSERPYDADEIDFLTQVAGQIAIAIDNSLAYEEISELRDKLAQEKEYWAQARVAIGGNGRFKRFYCPVAWGDRNGKRTDRSRNSRTQPAQRTHLRQTQLRRNSHRPAGKRTVRA